MRRLEDVVRRDHPEEPSPLAAIGEGRVLVDGRIVTNPGSMVRRGAAVSLRRAAAPLRGEVKLGAALDALGVGVDGLVALDAGAATGGFVKALLDRGARHVYAVDAGHGQLLGSLRQDARVVNLEATNLADLSPALVPDAVELVTLDLSYLSLTAAVLYLDRLRLAPGCQLLALVKPMFELALPRPPSDDASLEDARRLDPALGQAAGWRVLRSIRSSVQGARGAVEFWVHAAQGRPSR
jgi:23S rRNA (cytidine1920-2'-O)/16S rRNA (cytidine1409-2'-O)-methyltransferase